MENNMENYEDYLNYLSIDGLKSELKEAQAVYSKKYSDDCDIDEETLENVRRITFKLIAMIQDKKKSKRNIVDEYYEDNKGFDSSRYEYDRYVSASGDHSTFGNY